MKRLIPTLLLVIICIGGFWYASSKDFFKETKEPAAALVKVNKDEVASYSIKTGDEEIELQRKDGKWTMTKPSAQPLNDYSADGWVESFNMLSKDKTVDPNPSDLAQFGLDKPSQQFKVTLNNGESHTVSVGSPVAIQGFNYAMVSGSPEVFQLSDMQTKELAKAQIDFMETSPVKLESDKVSSLTVDWKGQKWTLSKTDLDKKSYESDWKLGEQVVKAADATTYLDKVIFLSTQQPARPSSEIKLDSPELRIEVKSTDASKNETTDVYAGKLEQDNVWLAKQGGEWAYALPVAAVQELSDKGKEPPKAPEAAPDAASPANPASPSPATPGAATAPSGASAPTAPSQSPAEAAPTNPAPAPATPAPPAQPQQPQTGSDAPPVPPQLQTPAQPPVSAPQQQSQPK